jgi:predicted RNase H-like nuclease
MSGGRVLGVDACRTGWVGVVLSAGDPSFHFAPDISLLADLAAAGGSLDAVAIDMPIGLPDASRRQADVLARKAAGPRWASVFITPVRAALEAEGYDAASSVNRQLAGEGISRQAFALRPKILQVDRWVHETRHRVVEAHPEVSFAQLAGQVLRLGKSTWAGAILRRRLLTGAGIALPDDLGPAGERAGIDDVLDAAVTAWTARRVASGQARQMPDPPEIFSDRLPCAIWT